MWMPPTIISVSGFSSEVGKTTLMCELLKRFKGWEAIKISRGHYRSCGKDPQACCISPLLGEHPHIFSGATQTCVPRKDTGRYWEAGASNVHWLICTTEQLEEGTRLALNQVQTTGVFVEGTSFLKFYPAAFSIMVISATREEIKSTALRVVDGMDAFYVADSLPDETMFATIRHRLAKRNVHIKEKPIYFQGQIDSLAEAIKKATLARSCIQLTSSTFPSSS
jgi:molybdopterin-guanine dinucleotide biosynthesis protein